MSWKHFSGEQISLQVSVQSATKASLDEILPMLSDDTAAQVQGYTPYYVSVSFTKTDLSQGEIAFSDAWFRIDRARPPPASSMS